MAHVVVVGAGNAGLCAAIAAREGGAEVTVLERAPEEHRGGNSTYTAGAMRVAYNSVSDLVTLMPDLTEDDLAQTDFGSYDESQFFDDLARITENRADPDLAEMVVSDSFETLRWMTSHGIRFAPIYGRQAFKVNGMFKFWGGLVVEAVGGGPGLVEGLFARAEDLGIATLYEAEGLRLKREGGRVTQVIYRQGGDEHVIGADAVILASGGFQANPAWRAQYLGPGWDLAKVRGTRYNTGGGIQMALEAGASPAGNWSGCHAVGWDFNAPEFGVLAVGDGFQKHSYPLGVMLNADGRRFVDEGADFRNYTYAKYGRSILSQPQQFAWQIFDQKVAHLLRDEYRIREVTKVQANTLEELVQKLEGVDAAGAIATLREFNAGVQHDVPFNPNVKDGRGSLSGGIPKSNWANALDDGPFMAFQVTCGITFTFGGVRVDTDGHVLDQGGGAIPGLYTCGEMAGGLFFFNYPGGSGLTYGSVLGRRAGTAAATESLGRTETLLIHERQEVAT